MDESDIMTAERTQPDGFLDGWEETSLGPEERASADPMGQYGASLGPEEPESGSREDQAVPETEDHEGAAGEDQTGEQQPPRIWTLNHLGQTVTAGEADMVALAQKGLDYDRIRSEYDEAKPVVAMFRDFAARAGMDMNDYLTHIRSRAKQAEGMSAQEARRAVELENREAVVAAQEEGRRAQEMAAQNEAARRQAADAKMRADLREFMEIFPDAAKDPGAIPKEVWNEVRGGRSLVAAYARYNAAQERAAREAARQQAAAREQNAANAARAVGSMRTAGSGTGSKDPFLEGWDD